MRCILSRAWSEHFSPNVFCEKTHYLVRALRLILWPVTWLENRGSSRESRSIKLLSNVSALLVAVKITVRPNPPPLLPTLSTWSATLRWRLRGSELSMMSLLELRGRRGRRFTNFWSICENLMNSRNYTHEQFWKYALLLRLSQSFKWRFGRRVAVYTIQWIPSNDTTNIGNVHDRRYTA